MLSQLDTNYVCDDSLNYKRSVGNIAHCGTVNKAAVKLSKQCADWVKSKQHEMTSQSQTIKRRKQNSQHRY